MMDYNEKQNVENTLTAGAKAEEYVAKHIDAVWAQAKQYCQEHMSAAVYEYYIRDLKVVSVARYLTITLEVRNEFILAIVSERYGKEVEKAFEEVLGTAVHLQFVTAPKTEKDEDK